MKIFSLLFVFCLFTLLHGQNTPLARRLEAVHFTNALIRLGTSANVPVLDGKISPKEWDDAVIINGFSTTSNRGQVLGSKQGQVFIKRTKDHLYVAVKTVTPNDGPGGGLLNNVTKNDTMDICNDDTVELTFHSEKTPDKLQHLLFNPGGARLDICRTLSSRHQDISWNFPGVECVSKVESFWWILEVKLPLNVLAPHQGKLRFNAARNWCDTGTFSTVNKVNRYFQPQDMIQLSLAQTAPIVHQNALGNPDDGFWQADTQLVNRYARDVIFAQMLHEYEFKKVDGKVRRTHKIHVQKSMTVKPGQSAAIKFEHNTGSAKMLWFATAVLDARTGQVLFRRLVQGRKSQSLGRQPVTAAGEIGKTGTFRVYDYPGYGYAAFFFKFKKAPVKHIVMTSPKGAKQNFKVEKRAGEFYCKALIPDTPGNYSFTLPDGTKICSIMRKKFAFLNNDHGKQKVVLPPFTPIKAAQKTLKTIYREHKINAFGLWDSVKSKGTELLDGPMYFELVSNNKKTTWKNAGVTLKVNNQGHDAAYTARAVNSSGITLKVKGYAEYDGFFWNSFKLENPQRLPIDRLTLCIPLKDEQAPLFHVVSNTIRTNPAGYLPKGQGELWNGTQLARQLHFGKAVMHNQLVPYVWLGGIEKGLCYFMDSTFGCRLANNKPQVRISRRGKRLILEADIINTRSNSKLHAFEFGLQATPVKPVHPDLLPMTRDTRGWVQDGLPNLGDFYQIRGGFPSQWATEPLGQDYTLYKKAINVLSGKHVPTIHQDIDEFFKKYKAVLKKDFDKEYPGRAEKIIRSALDTSSLTTTRRKASRPIMYTDPRLIHRYEEAARYFKSEWWNPARISYVAAHRVTLHPSLQDYFIYQNRKLMQCGLWGINLDDAFLMPDDNPDTVAKKDEWGVLHSNVGILQLRQYIKRLATMIHTEFKRYPRYVEVHMTNALIVPAFAFADGTLGFEQHYGEKPRTECFGEGEILATNTGRQVGAKALGLPGLLRLTTPLAKWKKDFPVLTRSHIALTVPFGITARTSIRIKYEHFCVETYNKFYKDLTRFGAAEKDCRFVPCFENKQITADNKNIRIGYYERAGKILACVSNAGRTKEKITLSFAGKPRAELTDWEKMMPLEKNFELAPGDFKLVYVR